MVLVVVFHAVVDVPWWPEGLRQSDVDGTVAVFSHIPLIVCQVGGKGEVVLTVRETVWSV